MMLRVLACLLCLLLAPRLAAAGPEVTPELTGEYAVEDGLRVLRLWGSPRERGFAQGYLLADEILGSMKIVLEMSNGKYEKRLLPLVKSGFRFSPAETEELEGMLEGLRSRLPEKDRWIGPLEREVTLADLKAGNTVGDWYALGCSSVAVWGTLSPDGTPAVVRNFDFRAIEALTAHMHLRIVVPGPDETGAKGWVGVTHPGSVGAFTALSGEGVFAAIHDVWILPAPKDFRQPNVPRLLAIKRIVMELPARGAVEAALDRCRGWHTLFGNNFLVATPDPGEGRPAGVIEYDTREDRDRGATLRGAEAGRCYVACTNHHRLRGRGLCLRYETLTRACRAERESPFDVPALFALGTRVAVPAPGLTLARTRFGTLHQVVALTGTKRLFVRFAPPGGNIRDTRPVEVDVRAVLGATAAKSVR